jgi:hypothetical protein
MAMLSPRKGMRRDRFIRVLGLSLQAPDISLLGDSDAAGDRNKLKFATIEQIDI